MIERGMHSYSNLQESVLAFSAGWDTCFFLACIYIYLLTSSGFFSQILQKYNYVF
jgi:hypothetical protein